MKVLVFRLRAPFGHFRRFYTTTSAMTHLFPPRTAILGIVGAILGIDRQPFASHLHALGNLKVSVALENPIRKITISRNYHHTKIPKRTQVPFELLRDPSYIIFISDENFPRFQELVIAVKNRHSVFPVYMGESDLLATFEFVDLQDTILCAFPALVHTVSNSSKIRIKPEKGVLYLRELATRSMKPDRAYEDHAVYVLRSDARPIIVEEGEVTCLPRWNVVWM